MMNTALIVVLLACLCASRTWAAAAKAKGDPNDNKGNTPFFLQDPYDQMCLGPNGFTVCDERALWVLTKRTGKKTYSLVSLLHPSYSGLCLDRKKHFFGLMTGDKLGITSCSKSGAKSWQFEFIDQTHVKLSNNGMCLVRGKKGFKNTASVQNCKAKDFLPLIYHPTAVHENGFFLKGADGQCFDGSKFRDCAGRGQDFLQWGVGVKFIYGEAKRYFFNFNIQDRNSCITSQGKKVVKGDCKSAGALKWGLNEGQLTASNGKFCVSRLADETAVLTKTSEENCEFIAMEVPTVYTDEQMAGMLKNPNLSEEERDLLMEAVQKRQLTR